VHPSGLHAGEDALATRAKNARDFSEQLSEDAQAATKHVAGLRQKYETQKTDVERLGGKLKGTNTKHDVVFSDLDSLKSQGRFLSYIL